MTTPTPAEFVREFSERYERLHVEKENAFWTTYMGLAEDADAARAEFNEKEIALSRFMQAPERLATVRRELARAESEGASDDTLTALRGWVRTLESNVIETEEARALAEELIGLESALARKRAKMTLGYELPGEGFAEASSVKLAVMIANDPEAAKREAAWRGLTKIEDFVLEHGFLEIVRKRNRLGRMLGGEDYYDWKTKRSEGMAKREIFALLDELEEKTREKARAWVESIGADAAKPWNVRFHAVGEASNEIQPYFPFSESFRRWGRSFAALGIDYRGADLVLDLVDRKGKYENGFCHGPVPCWRAEGTFRPARVQFTANAIPGMLGSGKRATETFFHEGGHAAHFANVDMPAPCFSQEFAPTSTAYAETQSMFLDSLLEDADWQTRYARSKEGEPVPFALIEKLVRAGQSSAAWGLRAMFAICYCERAIYEIPDDELTAERVVEEMRTWERKILFLDDASPRPALTVPHLISGEASAYYHGYVLALMAVHQTREFFLARDGYLTDNGEIGPDLCRAYWQPGNSKRFPEYIEALTGETVSPDALAASVNRTADEAVAAAKAKIDRIGDVPEHTGPVELNATIRIVHGNEEIASTASGFDAAASEFAAWIESQE